MTISSEIRYIQGCSMDALRFRDFARLRSGRDRFSLMRISELQDLVGLPAETQGTVASKFPAQADQAKVLRWMARGLSLDKAMWKVTTDLEIAQNVIDGRCGIVSERRRIRKARARREQLTAPGRAARDVQDM